MLDSFALLAQAHEKPRWIDGALQTIGKHGVDFTNFSLELRSA